MGNRFCFDAYDFEKNELGFSPEELETVRRLLAEGKKVYLAPVEVESEEQLEDVLHAEREKCHVWCSGPDRRLVYLTPAEESIFHYLVRQLDRRRKQIDRETRCLVPGCRKDRIRCPEENRCSRCPYGRRPEERRSMMTSWEELQEKGLDMADPSPSTEELAIRRMEYERLRESLEKCSERIRQSFFLKEVMGYSARETAELVGLPVSQVYRYLSEVRKVLRRAGKPEDA